MCSGTIPSPSEPQRDTSRSVERRREPRATTLRSIRFAVGRVHRIRSAHGPHPDLAPMSHVPSTVTFTAGRDQGEVRLSTATAKVHPVFGYPLDEHAFE